MTDNHWSHLVVTLERINKTLDNHEVRIRGNELSRAKAAGFAAAFGGILSGGLLTVVGRLL
jgi:hypothetical protein